LKHSYVKLEQSDIGKLFPDIGKRFPDIGKRFPDMENLLFSKEIEGFLKNSAFLTVVGVRSGYHALWKQPSWLPVNADSIGYRSSAMGHRWLRQPIQRTFDPHSRLLHHVQINLRGADVLMSK
jgi:hypothetical protein